MTSRSKLSRETFSTFLPFTISFLSILLLIFSYFFNSSKKEAVYTNTSLQIESLVTTLETNFSETLDTLSKLSASKDSLAFAQAEAFDPTLSLNTYNLFSKSFNTATNHNTYMGIYNPTLDLVVSNLGTSPLSFLLSQHNFSLADSITKSILTSSSYPIVLESDCGHYLLYIHQNTRLLEAPISIALFNMDYITQRFIPKDALFDFNIVLNQEVSYTSTPLTFSQTSSVLPLTYTATHHTLPLDSVASSFMLLFVFVCIIVLIISAYFSYKRIRLFVALHKNKEVTTQTLLLKEVIYGIKNPNIKNALTDCNISLLRDTFFMVLLSPKVSAPSVQALSSTTLDQLIKTQCSWSSYKLVMLNDSTSVLFISNVSRNDVYTSLKAISTELSDYYLLLTDTLTLTDISSVFYKTTQLLKNNILVNKSNVIPVEDIKINLPVSFTFTEQDKKLLSYHIATQNEDSFLTLIDKILTENLITKKLSSEFYNQFLVLMCEQLDSFAPDFKDYASILEDLRALSEPRLVKENLFNLFKTYYTHITLESPKNNMESKFLDYIHRHYHDDISLSDMAIHFNLAVNYVGVLFKEKTGFNFKDYLNTYRIKMAKELLDTSPQIKIKDLSLEVGFVNINTFIRIFKKYEGVSPGQYQKYLLDQSTSNPA